MKGWQAGLPSLSCGEQEGVCGSGVPSGVRFPDGRTTGPLGWLQAGPALQCVRQHLAAVGHCRARPASGLGIWSSTGHIVLQAGQGHVWL